MDAISWVNSPQIYRLNPWREGTRALLLVGVPSILGAVESASMGLVNSSLISLTVSPWAGALLGGAWAAGLEKSRKRGYRCLTILLGAALGMLALPVLKAPGSLGGMGGALLTATASAVGVGLICAWQSRPWR